jgi:HrpA-like RNA helicase
MMDADVLLEYFEELSCGIFSLETRVYPVKELFLESPTKDYISESVITVLKIHQNEPQGDILVILSGKEDVDTVVTLINDKSQK